MILLVCSANHAKQVQPLDYLHSPGLICNYTLSKTSPISRPTTAVSGGVGIGYQLIHKTEVPASSTTYNAQARTPDCLLIQHAPASSPMKILIFEREHGGHRLTTVRVLIEALLEFNEQHPSLTSITLATTDEAVHSKEYASQLSELSEQFNLHILPPRRASSSSLSVAWQKLQDYRRLIRSGQYDHGYVPYGDGMIQLLALCRISPLRFWAKAPFPVEAILMRGAFAYPQSRLHTRLIAYLSLRFAPFYRIHLNDPLAYRSIGRKLQKKSTIQLMPEPISKTPRVPAQLARQRLNIPEEGRLLGCVGIIDERKGLDRLIRAFQQSGLKRTDRLLLAGRQSSKLRSIINHLDDPRVLTIDRYLSESELGDAINALDLVVTPYPDFIGSVSIVIRAAAAARPTLSSNTGWTGYIVPTFQLGRTCDTQNQDELARELAFSLDESANYQMTEAGNTFVSYGTIANVNAHWCAGIRERLSLPVDSQISPWPDGNTT